MTRPAETDAPLIPALRDRWSPRAFADQMAGFDWRGANEALGIPDDYAAVAMTAIGYIGDPASLPEKLAKLERQPRERRPLAELAFEGSWPS